MARIYFSGVFNEIVVRSTTARQASSSFLSFCSFPSFSLLQPLTEKTRGPPAKGTRSPPPDGRGFLIDFIPRKSIIPVIHVHLSPNQTREVIRKHKSNCRNCWWYGRAVGSMWVVEISHGLSREDYSIIVKYPLNNTMYSDCNIRIRFRASS